MSSVSLAAYHHGQYYFSGVTSRVSHPFVARRRRCVCRARKLTYLSKDRQSPVRKRQVTMLGDNRIGSKIAFGSDFKIQISIVNCAVNFIFSKYFFIALKRKMRFYIRNITKLKI